MTAGEELAIVVHLDPNTPPEFQYLWEGENDNLYAGGSNWEKVAPTYTWGPGNADLGFRTYVASGPATESFTLSVNLSGPSSLNTTIPFTVGGTAVNGVDFRGLTAGPLVIPTGQTTANITGTLIDDGKFDPVNKSLTFNLGSPINADLGAVSSSTLTIQESDVEPTISFATNTQTVADNAGSFSATVSLSAPSNVDTVIPFSVGVRAVAGIDYSGLTSSPLVIPAGQTSRCHYRENT